MQILIYSHAFAPMVGGIETITMQLSQGLVGRREPGTGDVAQVTVVTPASAGTMDDSVLPFQIVRTPGLARLGQLIWQADVLHLAGPAMLPLLLGWLFRKPMVVEHHGFQTACPNGQFVYLPTQTPCPGHFMERRYSSCLRCNAVHGTANSLQQCLLTFPRRWLCRMADANILPTAWLGSVLRLPRMTTIGHGLVGTNTTGASPELTLPTVVFLGRLVSTKGVHVLLEAAHQLGDCDFRLKIIGDGPERGSLQARAKTLGLEERVVFLGYLDRDQIEQAVSGARAVVMPSLGGEVFGLSALENMLRKKLLIVSEIGSLTEVVGDAGLTFPAGDAGALASCLRRALQSEPLAEEMGERAIARAKSVFTADRMVNDHLALYRRLLGVCLPEAATSLTKRAAV